MSETQWVDFRAVKAAVTMQMLLARYGLDNLRQSGQELRGKCPIHEGDGERSFHVNLSKNAFNCFSCHARGNVLDLVAGLEHCTIRAAALKLAEWYGVETTAGTTPPKVPRQKTTASKAGVGRACPCSAHPRDYMESKMNITQIRPALIAGIAVLALAGCNRAESPSEVSADVQKAQQDRAEDVASAEAKQANVQADTATQAASADPDDRGDAIQDRAGAAYKTAMAKAEGDYKVAKEGCESAKGDAQAACKKSAEAAYEAAKSNALVVRDAERKRGDAVQKLDN